MAYVEEINRIEDLAVYRPLWHRLLAETQRASFFHTLEWLEIYWKHFGAGQKLRTLIVFSRQGPSGILPLVVRREATKVGRLRILTYPLHDWGSFYGPLGADPMATLAAGLEHCRRSPRDWDIMELRWIGRTACEPTARAMRSAGFHPKQSVWNRTAVVEFAGTFDDYTAGQTGKWRSNHRRYERSLAKLGDVVYLRYRPGGELLGEADPRWDLYDACEAIARRSWQGASTDGTTLTHPSVRPFFREAHAAAAKAGMVDLNLLYLAGQPSAFAYNYRCSDRVYGLRAGYDAAVFREGAGGALLVRTIEDGFERGDGLFDLGVGSLQGKRHLATRMVPIFRCSHYPLAVPRAQLVRLKRWTQQWLSDRGRWGNRRARPRHEKSNA
ncbi:MAG TPA: GNAT family N-acetyltransferase [Thermoguttaceae bacterium]|nr:GNAT family N-acetyltransferase [Thermoguttaceae bacterium]